MRMIRLSGLEHRWIEHQQAWGISAFFLCAKGFFSEALKNVFSQMQPDGAYYLQKDQIQNIYKKHVTALASSSSIRKIPKFV